MDIVEELRKFSLDGATYADLHGMLFRAADEIERLRSLAGAVSPGPSFADIRAMSHDSVGRPHPILKAFDGA